MTLTSPIMEEDHLAEQWLVWKDKLLKALDSQGIITVPQRYTFTESLFTGDTNKTFN